MTTHTEYIKKSEDKKLFDPSSSLDPTGRSAQFSKSDRKNMLERHVRNMDVTFKVFDMMQRHRFRGILDVDAELAQSLALDGYYSMLRKKLLVAEEETRKHMQEWELKEKEKQDEKTRVEEEQKAATQKKAEMEKMNQMMGYSTEIPILDPEEAEKKKKAAEDEENITLAAQRTFFMIQQMEKNAYEQKLRQLKATEDTLRGQSEDPKALANRQNFADFLVAEGVPADQPELARILFDAYYQEVSRNQRLRNPLTMLNLGLATADVANRIEKKLQVEPAVNVKSFIFNYGRYLKDKYKKKDLVSTKKARDLNSLLRTRIAEWRESYPKFSLPKMSKLSEEEKALALRDILPWEVANQATRKDLETFNHHKLLEEVPYVERVLADFNEKPYSTVKLQEKFASICGSLPVASSD